MTNEHNPSAKELSETIETQFNKDFQACKLTVALISITLGLCVGIMIGVNLSSKLGG